MAAPPSTPQVRLALVISGAVSLGAYEAGALTGLLRLIRASNGSIVVDTIAGASAGSITGLILAHALLSGAGEDDLEELWVRLASIETMLKGRAKPGRPSAPLTTTALEDWAAGALARSGPQPIQTEPIAMVLSITNIRGLRYDLAQAIPGRTVQADTFRDARAFLLEQGVNWADPMQTALASGANAFAFAPVRLDRHRSEYPPSVEFPKGDPAHFWYTDGGTVYNEPLGFAIDAITDPDALQVQRPPQRLVDPDGKRLFLLVHPDPSAPPEVWPPGGGDPTFRSASLRAMTKLAPSQSAFDDLRRLEKTNSRILARWQVQAALTTLLGRLSAEEGSEVVRRMAGVTVRRKVVVRSLTGGEIGADLQALAAAVDATEPLDPATMFSLVDVALDEASGTGSKDIIDVEVVSPELDLEHRRPHDILAGEKMGHFFGFALSAARESDFGLGYGHFRLWWEAFRAMPPEGWQALPGIPVPAHPLEEKATGGELSLKDIGTWTKLRLAVRLGWRYLREVLRRAPKPPG